jgi:hypothetical protein
MRAFLFRPLACLFALALTAAASAEGLVGLTTTNRLVTFDSATPGTVVAPIAITGLLVVEFDSTRAAGNEEGWRSPKR